MFQVSPLPYEYDALEPFIDEETMRVHHGGHYATYVKNLNDTLENFPAWQNHSVEELLQSAEKLPEEIRQKVTSNAGGVYNHGLFWQIMKPGGGSQPDGKLAEKINSTFGGFTTFREQFSNTASTLFGSGWTWLAKDPQQRLTITNTFNQNSPISENMIPLLCLDLWEHAYYLKYKNKRKDYIEAWWNVVNWEKVSTYL